MFFIDLGEFDETILFYKGQMCQLDGFIQTIQKETQTLRESWSGPAADVSQLSLKLKIQAMERSKEQIQRMTDIMELTMKPILQREKNRCDELYLAITQVEPPDPSYFGVFLGTVRLELEEIGGVESSIGEILELTKRERSIWNQAMEYLEGMEYVSLPISRIHQEFERGLNLQTIYANQCLDSIHAYVDAIEELETRAAYDFQVANDMSQGCSLRQISPIVTPENTINQERLHWLMGRQPEQLTETDFADMIMALDRLNAGGSREQVETLLSSFYILDLNL